MFKKHTREPIFFFFFFFMKIFIWIPSFATTSSAACSRRLRFLESLRKVFAMSSHEISGKKQKLAAGPASEKNSDCYINIII